VIPELDRQPSYGDQLEIGAFCGTSQEQIPRRRGVTQKPSWLGISTAAVWKRRRAALYDHGYTVLPVVDAMTDLNADAHRLGVENVFPLISETATTIDVLVLLKPCSRQEGWEARSAISLRALIALASDSNVASMSTSTQRIVMRKVCSGERSNFDQHRPKS
jgi:hypothetical protein